MSDDQIIPYLPHGKTTASAQSGLQEVIEDIENTVDICLTAGASQDDQLWLSCVDRWLPKLRALAPEPVTGELLNKWLDECATNLSVVLDDRRANHLADKINTHLGLEVKGDD